MTNAVVDTLKDLNEKSVKSAKRVGELNLKTFEELAAKQTKLMNTCFEAGTKNFEALTKAKNPQEFMSLQQEALKGYGEQWLASLRESADVLNAARNELLAIVEEATKAASEGTQKLAEVSKQAFNENMEKANEAMNKVVASAAPAASKKS
ncbi:phasin family protein [Thiolinea disciformis]|uniref:phasin family protein n=1 Tax=Thiolinea disciformis TaxID=125614 RepID=UPI00037899A7|nr:phasin family protein [Thiolinea disciformis]